jgi:glucosamine--fructose-6-phosphate aminotransferase (isomerizing)
MCGIVGYVGERDASSVLLSGLRMLEYRGYDSAGIAVLDNGDVHVRRSVGKLQNLADLLATSPVPGHSGIGHTRWATHGRPSEENAHPHRAGRVVLIHNGIIENFLELRAELHDAGRTFSSETDTEIIAHLIDAGVSAGADLVTATRHAVRRLEGSFAIVVMSRDEPDKLVAAKNSTPIVIGLGRDENFIASDVPALLEYTRDMLFLEDGEIAEIDRDGVRLSTFDGTPLQREPRHITWDPVTAQKSGYKHFMLKEIHEQPQAMIDTMRGRLMLEAGDVSLDEMHLGDEWWNQLDRIDLVACGTAWHACLVGKFYIEKLARIPCNVDYASEFRYRDPVFDDRGMLLVVSQSGETADTLAAVEAARQKGYRTAAVCNVIDSSIARRVDSVLYTHAGPEISVASTKAFVTQLTALLLLALYLGRRRGTLDASTCGELLESMIQLPGPLREALDLADRVDNLARGYVKSENFLYVGRGVNYPIALEGALKLKELSYIHAEGYPAGELKHGPIALISEAMPVVVLLPRNNAFAKTVSNMKEVESRGGQIIVVTDADDRAVDQIAKDVVRVPSVHPLLMPILLSVPLQLLSYFVAVHRGTDVDQPRNLAKSVTVE